MLGVGQIRKDLNLNSLEKALNNFCSSWGHFRHFRCFDHPFFTLLFEKGSLDFFHVFDSF